MDVDKRTLLYARDFNSEDITGHILPAHHGHKVAEMGDIYNNYDFHRVRLFEFLL